MPNRDEQSVQEQHRESLIVKLSPHLGGLMGKVLIAFIAACLLAIAYFHHSSFDDFAHSAVVTFLVSLGMIGFLALIGIGAWGLDKYHKSKMQRHERTIAEEEAEQAKEATQRARTNNRILEAKAVAAEQLPDLLRYAMSRGLNVEFAGAKLVNPLSNLHTIGGGQNAGLLQAPAVPTQMPTVGELVERTAPNSLTFGLGRSLTTQELIITDLDERHLKIIGATRMGKSCLIGAILDQLRQTHDPQHLQFAILDLEDKTGRLFESDEHILKVKTRDGMLSMHARNSAQVASYLIILHSFMNWRYLQSSKLGDEWLDRQPHVLVYLEEFLYWKRTLAQFVPDERTRDNAMAALNGLATRGLKAGIHLALAAQVDYADKDFADAMAQFVGVNVSFSVKPSAARAAGFVSTELLNANFEAKQPGQYVVEMIGGSDLGIAPDFNVKELVKALPRRAASLNGDEAEHEQYVEGTRSFVTQPLKEQVAFSQMEPLHPRNETFQTSEESQSSLLAPEMKRFASPEEKIAEIKRLRIIGFNQTQIIQNIWHVKPGATQAYQEALTEYKQLLEELVRKA
jgi:hypothetical protein